MIGNHRGITCNCSNIDDISYNKSVVLTIIKHIEGHLLHKFFYAYSEFLVTEVYVHDKFKSPPHLSYLHTTRERSASVLNDTVCCTSDLEQW